ncbi:hypothetical protein DSECCO2_608030 [anaerobic digester metagenome]
MLEKGNNLFKFIFRLNLPGNILECNFRIGFHVLLGSALAQGGHHLAIQPAGLTIQHNGKTDENDPRQKLQNNLQKRDLLHAAGHRDSLRLQGGQQTLIKIRDSRLGRKAVLQDKTNQGLLLDLDLHDLVCIHISYKCRIGNHLVFYTSG